jgi:hypothetical protein
MSTTMTMTFPTIILENSAFISSIHCSSNVSIVIQMSTADAFEQTQQWPEKDMVLVTNRLSCNPANERGVFLTQMSSFDHDTLVVKIEARPVSWKDVAKTMQIDYLKMEDQDNVGEEHPMSHNEL